MSRVGGWWSRLGATLRPGRGEAELAEELESHLQLAIDEHVRRGMTPEAARRAALLAFGGIDATKERVRDQRRLRPLENVVQDVRQALRMLVRERLFTVVVVLSFALGIGANTAIFGAVNAVLLQPLPYPDGDRLVMLWSTDRRDNDSKMPVTPGDYADWRAVTRSFSDLAASSDAVHALTGDGAPETVIGYRFAPEMFRVLGVPAAVGRTFEPSDGPAAVVLSDGLWRRRYHADRSIVGHSIRLDQKSYVVVGVMPADFHHPKQTELWTPLTIGPELMASRQRPMLRIVARLRPGVGAGEAGAELRALAATQAKAHPESNALRGATVEPLRNSYTGDARPALLVLLGAVGFVLLLTSTNIAGLSLARAARRGRELAVRAALGASRLRIVQQLLTESLILALLGGAGGILVALWAADLLVQLFPQHVSNLDLPLVEHISLDGAVVLFSFGATLVAGLLAGLWPALRASRPDLAQALKDGGRGTARASRLRPFLVAGQIGLALILSSGAALLIRSEGLRQRGLGFAPARLFTARVLLDNARYPDGARQRQFLNEMLTRLRAAPGVASAGVVGFLPLCGWSSSADFHLPGRPTEALEAGYLVAEPGYFTTMHVPLVRGRAFDSGDDEHAPKVVLVDQRFARRWLAERDPVGARLDFGTPAAPDWREVIGVVGDVMNDPPPAEQRPMIYASFTQAEWPFFGLVIRATDNPVTLATTVRDVVSAIDREQPVSYAMTMDALVGDALAVSRTSSFILAFFAVVALALAAMGVYGVLAHHVLERRHEIGIRLALGAQRRHVLGFMLRMLALMTGAGVLAGIAGTLAATRVLAALLYGVSPAEPLLLAAMVLLLVGVAALAAYLPLRRALRTDPMVALRQE